MKQNYSDPHRYNPNVHYRLYQGPNGPMVACLQDFDYYDYDASKFLSPEAWDDEEAAKIALLAVTGTSGIRAIAQENISTGDAVLVVVDPATGIARVIKARF